MTLVAAMAACAEQAIVTSAIRKSNRMVLIRRTNRSGIIPASSRTVESVFAHLFRAFQKDTSILSELQLMDNRIHGNDVNQGTVELFKRERPCSSEQGRFILSSNR
jgi:hypothetical protein